MTDSLSDETVDETVDEEDAPPMDEAAELGARLAEMVGATGFTAEHGTVRLLVERDKWVSSIVALRGEMQFFSWLSAIDWSKEIEVGDPVADTESLDERYDVMCRMSSVTSADGAIVVTSVPKDDAWVESLVGHFGGAEWHEREAAEMFGIDFRGNPNLTNLYLPDAFEGYPLRKSFPLLSREVKPWPGTVDVEGMPDDGDDDGPTTANTEAGDA